MKGNIVPLVTDTTSQESLAAAASTVRSREGYVSVVIACAGVTGPLTGLPQEKTSIKELQTALWNTPIHEFTQTMNVNVSGVFYTAVAFLDLLDAANQKFPAPHPKSQVITVSSIAGFTRGPGGPIPYCTSKAGAIHMMKQLSTSFAPYKIRFNSIAPGFYPTEMNQNVPFIKNSPDPTVEGGVSAKISPLERIGSAEDINGLILFMISRAGGYLSGSVQITDGGTLSVLPASY